ncbi:hypothetical protein KIPB_016574, partial [Kipferlia bialata]
YVYAVALKKKKLLKFFQTYLEEHSLRPIPDEERPMDTVEPIVTIKYHKRLEKGCIVKGRDLGGTLMTRFSNRTVQVNLAYDHTKIIVGGTDNTVGYIDIN